MGGIGSGRYLRWEGRDTIDQCPRIAIGDEFITLKYIVTKNDNEPDHIEQQINMTYTACHLGGSRP